MPNLNEAMVDEVVRALIWGPTGSGKTTLWGLLARHEKFRPIYCFDFDMRIASLRARLKEEEMSHIFFDEYRDKAIQGEAYIAAEYNSRNFESIKTKYKQDFKTIVIDSGTFCMMSMMSRVLMLDGKPANSNPQLQHYLSVGSMFNELIQRMCGMKLNFILTTLEDTEKDEIVGKVFKGPDLTGKKIGLRIPGYFNELWHTEVAPVPGGDPKYIIRTRSDAIHSARTSFGFLQSTEPQEEIWPKIINGGR